jgi:quinolinate synthase
LWPGACEVHVLFSSRKLFELKEQHPTARVIAHPECSEAVLAYADVVGSTSRLLQEVAENKTVNSFIVATEHGIFHQMKKSRPDATLIQAPTDPACACNECPYMKMNTLEKIRNALRDLSPRVEMDEKLRAKAQISLDRMMSITNGHSVSWPEKFLS